MFKKILLLVVFLAVGCSTATPTPTLTPEPTPDDDEVSIGLVIAVGSVNDGGYNALALAGVSSVAQRVGGSFSYVEPTEEKSADVLLEEMAASGEHQIIVTTSNLLGDITVSVANEYPDIHFIGLDQIQLDDHPNVTGIVFPEEQAGFLAGVLAANLTQTDIVAGVYGPDTIEPIQAFAGGFHAGAIYVNPDIEVLDLFHPEGPAVAFSDIPWGGEAGTQHLDSGADVIFTAAGDTGRGALIAVANRLSDVDQPLYCIGVDTDQWLTAPQARPCLVSSAMKSIPEAVDEVVAQVLEGNPPSGNYLGPVGLAPFHDFEDMISDELKAEIDQIAADLVSGALNIHSDS